MIHFLLGKLAPGHYAFPARPATNSQSHIFRLPEGLFGTVGKLTQKFLYKGPLKIGWNRRDPDCVRPEFTNLKTEGVQQLMGCKKVGCL